MSRDYVALKAAHKKRVQQLKESGATGEEPGEPKGSPAGSARQPGRLVPIGMVVGLGNPGAEFDETRHNAGFAVVDALAEKLGASYWKSRPGALVAEIEWPRVAGARVRLPNGSLDGSATAGPSLIVLVKPQSYMNVSGGPVAHLAKEYGVPAAGILVAHDDLEVDAGRIRVRMGGGHAGHNGLRSLCDKLGTREFGRLRVGIGRPPGRMEPADFVLKRLRGSEAQEFAVTVADAADIALFAIEQGMAKACARYA
jgi:PTH1 family peptidyl-tRNA hydrolase